MDRSVKHFLRRKCVKIFLTLSAFISFMLIFCSKKASVKTIYSFRSNNFIEKMVIETESITSVSSNIYEKMIAVENKDAVDINEKSNSKATDIKDVFISVKTTLSFHKTRMKLLLDTWISTRKNQVSRCI
jgi:hypothetical protein